VTENGTVLVFQRIYEVLNLSCMNTFACKPEERRLVARVRSRW
jgi:hypothetical protein